MNADLKAAVKINSLAGKVRPFDLMMDLITRYGHWAFVIYGLLLWFTPGKTREDRRNACVSAFIGVCIASLISYAIGRVWKRERPFRESPQIWNFTGHRANASFPSNHTMNGCVVAMELLRHNTKGSKNFIATIKTKDWSSSDFHAISLAIRTPERMKKFNPSVR